MLCIYWIINKSQSFPCFDSSSSWLNGRVEGRCTWLDWLEWPSLPSLWRSPFLWWWVMFAHFLFACELFATRLKSVPIALAWLPLSVCSFWAEDHAVSKLPGHSWCVWLCCQFWDGSRSHSLVHRGRAVLPGTPTGRHGCLWFLQLDCKLPGGAGFP